MNVNKMIHYILDFIRRYVCNNLIFNQHVFLGKLFWKRNFTSGSEYKHYSPHPYLYLFCKLYSGRVINTTVSIWFVCGNISTGWIFSTL